MSTQPTVEVVNKPTARVVLEGALYVLISAIPPAITVLQSEIELTPRTLTILALACIVAGATALKAYLSTTSTTESK